MLVQNDRPAHAKHDDAGSAGFERMPQAAGVARILEGGDLVEGAAATAPRSGAVTYRARKGELCGGDSCLERSAGANERENGSNHVFPLGLARGRCDHGPMDRECAWGITRGEAIA